MEAEFTCLGFESVGELFLGATVGFGADGFVVGGFGGEHAVDDASNFMSGGGDSFGWAEPGPHAAVEVAETGVALAGRLGGQAKRGGRRGDNFPGFSAEDSTAGDAVVGAQAQPGGKMIGRSKTGFQIDAGLADDGVGQLGFEARDGSQVDSANAIEFGAGVEAQCVALRFATGAGGVGQRFGLGIGSAGEGGELLLDLQIALTDLGLVEAPGFEGLAQGEEMFGPVVADQGFFDGGIGSLDAVVFEFNQLLWATFAGQNRVEHGLTGGSDDVADDVVQLQVHLGERLLDVLHVFAREEDLVVAMPADGAHGTDLLGRAKRSA